MIGNYLRRYLPKEEHFIRKSPNLAFRYNYGKAACSYQIQLLKDQEKCVQIPEDNVDLFNNYIILKLG